MTGEQRVRLDAAKARLETLQNMGVRAQGAIVRAEEATDDAEVERLIASAESELSSILKRKRGTKR